MSASFRAYIDESGEEGFKFRVKLDEPRSSDWFVLSAFVTRKTTDLETVKVIGQVRQEFGLPPKKHIHWKKLKHLQKVRYAQIMSGLRARVVSVLVHKPSLLEPEKFRERYRLYFYAVRYLMERLSWLARDRHDLSKWGGDGTMEVVFSNRQGMSYGEMRDYLARLKLQKENGKDIRIDFDKVPIERISATTPGRSMGLQLADAAAGAHFNGLERDAFGNTEPRYVTLLAPIMYKHQGLVFGYGRKVVPREVVERLEDDGNLKWLCPLK